MRISAQATRGVAGVSMIAEASWVILMVLVVLLLPPVIRDLP